MRADQKTDGRGTIPEAWLLDAPLFIDDQQIKSLYNAVALPEFEQESVTISQSDVKVSKWAAETQIEVSAGESLLGKLLVGLSGKASAKGSRAQDRSTGSENTWKLIPVDTPERRLLNLALHYAANSRKRVWTVRGLDDVRWLQDADFRVGTPRSLVFLEIPPGFPIVPMAAETPNGKVLLFFERVAEAVAKEAELRPDGPSGADVAPPPDYPRDGQGGQAMIDYWNWFQHQKIGNGDSSSVLMRVIEDAVGDGRPRWIDYRVPLGPVGHQERSLHLHLKGREAYDTGDFAYQVVRRGRRHGLRVVGTAKAGPALNVLALYEI